MRVNPEVDAWFAARDDPITDARQRVREVILGADDRVTESIKWKTPKFQFRGELPFAFEPGMGAGDLRAAPARCASSTWTMWMSGAATSRR